MGHVRHCFARLVPGAVLRLLAALAGLALFAEAAQAQIRINEIFPNPVGSAEAGLEWVEIYNAGGSSVDLTGWAIDDAVTIGQTAVRGRIPEDFAPTCSTSAVIGPGEYRVVKMPVGGGSVLNNGGDDVYLVSDRLLNATQVHLVTYPPTVAEGESWACIPNGTTSFAWRTTITQCATNGSIGDVTAPGTVTDLAAVPGDYPGEIRLTWTAPGDDGATGTASAYVIKVAHATITAGTFDAMADLDRWITEPLPAAGGTPETLFVFGLDPDSSWCFALKAQDEVPNTSAVSNSPCSSPLAGTLPDPDLGYNTYFGNLHSHTSYSDGMQTPADAYAYARFSAQTPLDFLAVTDHNHASLGMTPALYAQGLAQAATANSDGNFVAMYGQEWGVISTGGHAIVLQAPVLFGWDSGNYDVFVAEGDYTGLYSAVLANPPVGYPPVVEWCHPNGGDFESFARTADGLAVVHLMNMINGPAFSTSTTESDVGSTTGNEVLFQAVLRDSFRVSPTGDQDNHNANWGASTQSRTAVLAPGRTRGAVLDALAARRCYATQDHNTIVHFSADGHAMGEAWNQPAGARFAVQVIDSDPGETVSQIDLLRGLTGTSAASVVASSAGNSSFAWRERAVFPEGTEAHYYLRIRMSTNATIWTGPVYVTYQASTPVAVDERPSPAAGLRLAARPNPTRGGVTAEFTVPRAGSGSLALYDLSGRRVRTLLRGSLAAGPHTVAWDGLSDDGARPRAGIFFLRLETPAGKAERKVLLLQ